jgi:uncharacterized protein with PQ loop repeat
MTREEVAEKIRWKKIIWFVGVLNPFFMAPQLRDIWATGVTDGISILTLIILFSLQVGFSIHGFFIRDGTIMKSGIASSTVTLITIMSVLYFRL